MNVKQWTKCEIDAGYLGVECGWKCPSCGEEHWCCRHLVEPGEPT